MKRRIIALAGVMTGMAVVFFLATALTKSLHYSSLLEEGDVVTARITGKEARPSDGEERYYIRYTYHDTITGQGYSDIAEITYQQWQKTAEGNSWPVTYWQKQPDVHVAFVVEKAMVYHPFLHVLPFIGGAVLIFCVLALLVYLFPSTKAFDKKKAIE